MHTTRLLQPFSHRHATLVLWRFSHYPEYMHATQSFLLLPRAQAHDSVLWCFPYFSEHMHLTLFCGISLITQSRGTRLSVAVFLLLLSIMVFPLKNGDVL
jgi:hypothetical protein